jgi:hypothetical protein
LAGHWYHTAAIGDLITSLYAAGREEFRDGPDDPAPGVASITAVVPALDMRRLDQAIEVNQSEQTVLVQGRCRLQPLRVFLETQGLAFAPPRSAVTELAEPQSVGQAVIRRQLAARWVEVLTAQGTITRHAQDQLPPDALVVLVALEVVPECLTH